MSLCACIFFWHRYFLPLLIMEIFKLSHVLLSFLFLEIEWDFDHFQRLKAFLRENTLFT